MKGRIDQALDFATPASLNGSLASPDAPVGQVLAQGRDRRRLQTDSGLSAFQIAAAQRCGGPSARRERQVKRPRFMSMSARGVQETHQSPDVLIGMSPMRVVGRSAKDVTPRSRERLAQRSNDE
jgi:hypothetical protein